jgi:beta-glucanase (GH16 family)
MKKLRFPVFLIVFATALVSCTLMRSTSSSEAASESGVSSASSSEAASSSSSESSTVSSAISAPDGYKLSWSDEFDGTELNDEYWSPMIGNGSDYGIWGWGNGEAEYYSGDNAEVSDGSLTITAKAEEHTVGTTLYEYSSARLRTAGKVSTTYGRIEARIALPAIQGLWPAFWMLPESTYNGKGWPTSGEIDIMENKGSDAYGTSGALHYQTSVSGGDVYQYAYNGLSKRNGESITDFHVYAIEWDEDEIDWYVDDANFLSVPKRTWHPDNGVVYTSDDDAPFNQPFHILLNLAVGGAFDDYALPPSDFSSAEMKVDYVRIFERE